MKKILALNLLLSLPLNMAFAWNPYTDPVMIKCIGEMGTMGFQSGTQGIGYSLNVQGLVTSGFVSNKEVLPTYWQSASINNWVPSNQNPATLNVVLQGGGFNWAPEHKTCLWTRAGVCLEQTIPGKYTKTFKDLIWLKLDMSNVQQPKFKQLSISGAKSLNLTTLGPSTQCQVKPYG